MLYLAAFRTWNVAHTSGGIIGRFINVHTHIFVSQPVRHTLHPPLPSHPPKQPLCHLLAILPLLALPPYQMPPEATIALICDYLFLLNCFLSISDDLDAIEYWLSEEARMHHLYQYCFKQNWT